MFCSIGVVTRGRSQPNANGRTSLDFAKPRCPAQRNAVQRHGGARRRPSGLPPPTGRPIRSVSSHARTSARFTPPPAATGSVTYLRFLAAARLMRPRWRHAAAVGHSSSTMGIFHSISVRQSRSNDAERKRNRSALSIREQGYVVRPPAAREDGVEASLDFVFLRGLLFTRLRRGGETSPVLRTERFH